MPTLGEYVNVYNSALNVLSKKGFQLWYDEEAETFCAERDGWDFMADSPLSLLGLVAMFEAASPRAFGEYWWKDEGALDYRSLPREPRPYVSVMKSRTTLGG